MDDSTVTVPEPVPEPLSGPLADLPPLLAAARVSAPKHRWVAIAAAVDFSTAEPAPASRVGWGDSPATA